jgi:hypothetical protein
MSQYRRKRSIKAGLQVGVFIFLPMTRRFPSFSEVCRHRIWRHLDTPDDRAGCVVSAGIGRSMSSCILGEKYQVMASWILALDPTGFFVAFQNLP